jgi:hypothetical protein
MSDPYPPALSIQRQSKGPSVRRRYKTEGKLGPERMKIPMSSSAEARERRKRSCR